MEKQANWYSLEMLPIYLEMSFNQLEASQVQLQNLNACKGRAHVLNDTIVERIIKIHTEQNDSNWVITEQCRKWRERHNPNKQQLEDITQIEKSIKELEIVNTQVLNLAAELKTGTADRIFEKSNLELALDFLTQNISRR